MPNNPAPRWPKMAKVKDSILDHIGMLDPAGQHNLLAGKFIAGKLMTSSWAKILRMVSPVSFQGC